MADDDDPATDLEGPDEEAADPSPSSVSNALRLIAPLAIIAQAQKAAGQALAGSRAERRPPPTVSHYTDAAGVIGVVERRQLWATDAFFMNDSSEVRYMSDFFHARLRQVIHDNIAAITGEVRRGGVDIQDDHAAVMLEQGFHDGFETERYDAGVYAMCFCEDGDLLSQWRGYGKFGGGYSLQFATSQMTELVRRSSPLSFVPVLYHRAVQEQVAHDIMVRGFGTLASHLLRQTAAPGLLGDADVCRLVGTGVGRAARTLTLHAKDPAFEEENEWRLIYRSSAQQGPSSLKRQFRPTARGITPYVAIPTDAKLKSLPRPFSTMSLGAAFPRLPLSGITVGATAGYDTARRSLSYLLKDHGIDVPIGKSAIPLRG